MRFSDVWTGLKWILCYRDTWPYTFLFRHFAPLLQPMWLWSWEDLFYWRNFFKSRWKNSGFLITLETFHCCSTYPDQGLWGVIWKLWDGKNCLCPSVPSSGKSELTRCPCVATLSPPWSVQDLLPHNREGSLFPARKCLVPSMNLTSVIQPQSKGSVWKFPSPK